MNREDKYSVGWSDFRGEYGTPKVEWEPIKPDRNYDLEEVVGYIGLATGMSMALAPMAWVSLIAWVLA